MSDIYDHYWWIGSDFDDYDSVMDTRSGPKRAYCRRCGEALDEWYPRPLEAWLNRPLHAVWLQSRAALVHADIWRQIAQHCPSAVIGPVMVRHGDLDRFTLDWVTVLFPPNEIVHIRGGPASPDRGIPMHICETCNRQQFANGIEPRHLVRRQVPRNRAVFMDHGRWLIIAEPIAQQVDWSDFPDFYYDRLEVRDRPLDGIQLLGDPDWSQVD